MISPPIHVRELAAPEQRVNVEEMASYTLVVQNQSARPVTIQARVEGLDPAWVILSPERVTLAPDAEARLRATIVAPRHATSRAGCYPFSFCLASPELPDWKSQHSASLVLHPFQEVGIWLESEAEPQRVGLLNAGNERATVRLAATSSEGVEVALRAPGEAALPHVERTLAAGERLSLAVEVTAARRAMVARQMASFQVTLTGASPAPQTVVGQLPIAPRLSGRWMAGGVGGALLLGALLLVALLGDPFQSSPPLPVAAPPQAEPVPYLAAFPAAVPARSEPSEPVGWNTLTSEQAPLVPVEVASPVPIEEVQALAALIAPPNDPTLQDAPAEPPPAQSNGARQAAPAATTDAPLPIAEQATVPSDGPERYEALIQEVALHYGLDWHLLASMAYHESRFNPRALGRDSDAGLMQIIPGTWALVAPKVNVHDPFDPYSSLMAGGYFLTSMQQHFASLGYPEIHWALAAYNWGPTNLTRLLQRGGRWEDVPVEVQWYVWRILDDAAHPTAAWWQNELQTVAYP